MITIPLAASWAYQFPQLVINPQEMTQAWIVITYYIANLI